MTEKSADRNDDPYRANRSGAFAIYGRVSRDLAAHPLRLVLILLAALGASAGTVAIPWLVRTTLQRFDETPAFRVTALGLVAIAGVSVLVVGLQFVARYGMAWLGQSMLVELRRRLFDKSLALPPADLARTGSGNVISRILNDVAQLEGFPLHGVLVPVGRTVTAVGLLATMVYLSWPLTLVVLLVGPVVGSLLRYAARKIGQRIEAAQHSKAQMTGLLHEQFRGLLEILSYGAQAQERARFGRINRQSAMHALAATRHHASSEGLIATALIASLIFTVGVGAYLVAQGTLSRTDLFTFGLLFIALYEPIRQLSTTGYEIQRGLTSARRIYAVLDTPSEPREGRSVVEPVRGWIDLEAVDFRYAEGQTRVLRGVDLRIPARESVALAGRSGAGKTSLIYLLLGFYPATAGRVRVDGQDVAELNRDGLRRHIGWVSQTPFLFQGTLDENIRFGSPEADDEAVRRAAQLADVESFVSGLPEGYRTRLHEGGANLSQGQRVRVALARAILRDPAILILDEPTSSLDSETEARIYSGIAEWLDTRTTIVISHRLSTVLSCRSGIVLEAGRVVSHGSTRQLFDECEHFRRLFREQIRHRSGGVRAR